MDDQTVAELSALRARAYGPGADLDDDPEAIRRLHELEELALARRAEEGEGRERVEAPAALAASAVPSAGPSPVPEVATVGEDLSPPDARDDDGQVEPPGLRLWWTRRRVALLWAASLVAVLVVSSAASAAFTYRLQADPREEAALSVDPTREVPEMFGGGMAESRVFSEFYGLLPIAVDYGDPSFAGLCLTVVAVDSIDEDSGSFTGPGTSGCGAGRFPATASFVVSAQFPDELRERFPDGTALQFELQENRVVVLSMPPEPQAEPTQEASR